MRGGEREEGGAGKETEMWGRGEERQTGKGEEVRKGDRGKCETRGGEREKADRLSKLCPPNLPQCRDELTSRRVRCHGKTKYKSGPR